MSVRILVGDCREQLKTLLDESVHCCVTSPPYFGLRDYGVAGQIGLEPSPDEYVAELVNVFREVRRVLRSDGTLWLNLGDSYANDGKWGGHTGGKHVKALHCSPIGRNKKYTGLKPKDLIGIPWLVAFALRDDGWYLRRDIIWHKLNPMPESVEDRCSTAHEYLFHFTKSASYFYDADAIAEVASYGSHGGSAANPGDKARATGNHSGSLGLTPRQRKSVPRGGFNGKTNAIKGREAFRAIVDYRNKRSVWSLASDPYPDAHFATFPPSLIEPCILAGCPAGGIVLDPFGGSGTTALVADREGRDGLLIEIKPEYAVMAGARIDAERMGRDEGRAHIIKQNGKVAAPGPLFEVPA
jgi:DNA modification methylase